MTKYASKSISFPQAALTIAAAIIAFAPGARAADASIPAPRLKPAVYNDAALPAAAKVGIARVDEGYLKAASFDELYDWAQMSLRLDPAQINFAPISPVAMAWTIPNSFEAQNKVDQIRLAAANQGMSHVIIYGQSDDQGFGGISSAGQGLSGEIAAPRGHGTLTAIVVGTYSGRIYGTVQAQDSAVLTEKVQRILGALSAHNLSYIS